MAPLVEPNNLLGEQLGEAVSVERGLGLVLADRVLFGQHLSVDLGGTDVDQQGAGNLLPDGLEEVEGPCQVHLHRSMGVRLPF